MNFDSLSLFVTEVNSTNSINDKKEILSKFKDVEFIRKVLYYTYNPFYQYYVTPDNLEKNYTIDLGTSITPYSNLFQLLDDLCERRITGHTAIQAVNDFCFMNETHKSLIYKIIGKDLEIRMGDSLINKVIPNLIPTFDCALAADFDDVEVDFATEEWHASRKLDGVRCLTIIDNANNVTTWSRQGNQFETLKNIETAVKQLGLRNVVLDGEICLVDANGNENFQGIMKQIRRKDHTIDKPKYLIFDMLSIEEFNAKKGNMKYSDRLVNLKQTVTENTYLTIVEQNLIVDNSHFNSLVDEADQKGWEGLILRKNVGYEGKRGKNMLKCKTFKDAEYEVIDLEFGPFRMIENGLEVTKEVLSNVVIEHKGNRVSVGSGFSISEREYFKTNPSELLNKVITVKYFQETKNQTGTWSLRFPTVKIIHGAKRLV